MKNKQLYIDDTPYDANGLPAVTEMTDEEYEEHRRKIRERIKNQGK